MVLICAVLTANSAPQASRLDFGDRERKGKDSGRGKKGKGRREKGEGDKGKENGKQGKGKEREEGRGREEFCTVVIFP